MKHLSFNVKLPVVQKDYSNEILQKRLAQTCRDIGDIQKSTTNIQGSMTSYRMHETNSDFMKVCKIAINFANKNTPVNTTGQTTTYMTWDCWGAIYSKGDYAKTHAHWPFVWSFVYYVECCKNCSPLIFDDCSSTLSIQPKSGNMILFPAWLLHSVPKQQCDHDRIILSGNLVINPWAYGYMNLPVLYI